MSAECIIDAGGAPLVRIVDSAGDIPIVTVALHAGHVLRPGLAERMGIGDDERLREEDPYTARMAPASCDLIEVLRSRFEVDLNRPRFRAVYQGPADSWGMPVWRGELPDAEDRISRSVYDTFYATAFDHLSRVAERHERFLVLDLHSYNHRRDGADKPPADERANPEINVGTGRFDRTRWTPVVDAFLGTMIEDGLDARENVKFRGGHFAHWVADTFPEQGAALAIEFKKTYMDEWTGQPDEQQIRTLAEALEHSVNPLVEALRHVR